MINFEEEIQKFNPSPEVESVHDVIYGLDITDATDIFIKIIKDNKED